MASFFPPMPLPGAPRPTAQRHTPAGRAWLAWLIPLVGVLPSFLAVPAWAGSATADSIMGQQNAQQRALQMVPKGATVTRTSCEEIGIRGDTRYRCSVWYDNPPAKTPETQPDP